MKISRNNRQASLAQTSDIFNDILLPLNKRPQHNAQNVVYFYRLIGFDNQTEFTNKLTFLHEKLANLGDLYLYFIDNIPLPFNKQLTDKINQALAALTTTEPAIICETLEQEKLLTSPQIKAPLEIVLGHFIKNKPTANASMVKNLVGKLLLWVEQYVPQLFKANAQWNPKILYYGDIKKHSVYFLILLSQLGCDVLYINTCSDTVYKSVDSNNQFSRIVEGNTKTILPNPPIKEIPKHAVPVDIDQLDKVVPTKGHSAVIKLKQTNDILRDLLLPLSKRSGYLGNPSPVLPVYFYRHIGIADTSNAAVDEYYNRLFQLDKALNNCANGYIRLTDHVAMPQNNEIINYKSKLQQSRATLLQGSEVDLLINKVVNAKILPTTNSEPLNNTIKTAFAETLELLVHQEPDSSQAKLENFSLKLVGWITKYFKSLYQSFEFKDNPKILYYGDIKQHEVYFLIYFSKIGCDVLYVNTNVEKDNVFKEIDPKEQHSKLIQQQNSTPLDKFPKVERTVRKATVAYNASQEIEQAIYNEDVGLFKPWQFEDYLTKPVTLKTTYDELKILWQEEARIRPEFKIVDNTVYIPNLFAKIKGTHEQLAQYWQDYKQLTGAKNTYTVTSVPFTNVPYSKRDLYSSAFLFNNEGLLDKKKLQQSEFYKFDYLKTSLQDFIIRKTIKLIEADVFKNQVDQEMKLKILMTILTMDDNILRLIETFDYTKQVPKLVIYDSTKEVFSDEDAIIIAFLNLVGLDIVIFTPTNYNNIELKLKEDLLDLHQLPSLQMDLAPPDFTTMPTEEGKISTFINHISKKVRRKFN
ncbi:MAG: hypothetical protein FH758_10475 [Firmicutes bacterium]|nr:hypothetical protein [Bacillota bacterium]